MKKILLLIIVVIVIVWWLRQPPVATPPQISPLPSDQLESVTYQNKTYRFTYFTVSDLRHLRLIANTSFEDSKTLIERNQCRYLTNGGFYDENHKPLGWLVSDGQELSAPIASRLFDGFLAISDLSTITFNRPENLPRAAVQSGPMLMFEGTPLSLRLANDELRRRVIALLVNDELIFMTVVGQDSELSGPYLSDLPGLVEAIAGKNGWQVSQAINLDGGTASAFYTDKVYLEELNPVGSIFCYN